jgi:hypothetical protein
MKSTTFAGRAAKSAAALILSAGLPMMAQAATMTFDSLPGDNGSAFTSYSEAGMTLTKTSGSGCVAKGFGNPLPDVFLGSACDSTQVGTFNLSGLPAFKFLSIDLSANNGAADYSIIGLLNGITQWTQAGSQAGPHATFLTLAASASDTIDTLVFTFKANGTSMNFDNIKVDAVAAVPAPASLALLMMGAAMGLTMRRKSK